MRLWIGFRDDQLLVLLKTVNRRMLSMVGRLLEKLSRWMIYKIILQEPDKWVC
jgi:hypothetical protein